VLRRALGSLGARPAELSAYPLAIRHSHPQHYQHVQRATDATILRGLAQPRDLRIVERSGDDDLGVDTGDSPLSFGGAKARLESAE